MMAYRHPEAFAKIIEVLVENSIEYLRGQIDAGADVLHLLREVGPALDWPRLLMRFGDSWRVLLSHLILFGFVYPDKRQNVPSWVMDELMRRLTVSKPNLQSDVCYGTLLSREQYIHDIERWKYRDARQPPEGSMTDEQIKIWTEAIGIKK